MGRLPARIEGRGILVRRWTVGDAEDLAVAIAASADHLRPWMAWMADHPQPLAERRAQIAEWERQWLDGGDVLAGMFVDGQVAGSCGLHRRIGPDGLEIGYWTHASWVRRGLASSAAGLLTDAAFDVDGIDRVEIHHDKANVASAGVPRRLGYRLAAERPDAVMAPAETGVECVWRITRGEWDGAAVAPQASTEPPTARSRGGSPT